MSYSICILCLTLAVFFLLWIPLAGTSKSSESYRGPFLDNACIKYGGCVTEEQQKKAVEECWNEYKKMPGYSMVSRQCGPGGDPEIKKYACPETCDIADLSGYAKPLPGLPAPSSSTTSSSTPPPITISSSPTLISQIQKALESQSSLSKTQPTTSTASTSSTSNSITTTPPAWISY